MGAKVSISLTDKMMDEINQRIEAGSYTSVSEVIRAGLRSLEREEEEHQERINLIRGKINLSANDPRDAVSSVEAFSRIRSNLKNRFSSE